jgi:hypothetical protein
MHFSAPAGLVALALALSASAAPSFPAATPALAFKPRAAILQRVSAPTPAPVVNKQIVKGVKERRDDGDGDDDDDDDEDDEDDGEDDDNDSDSDSDSDSDDSDSDSDSDSSDEVNTHDLNSA